MRWDTFDCAFMGTSLTTRITAKKWMDDLGSGLRLSKQRPIQLYDFGEPGVVASYGITASAKIITMRPKAVVIEYGMNDALTANGISVSTFKANLTSICTAFASGSPTTAIFLMTMNPAISPGAALVPNLANYYQGIRDVALAQSVGLIDNTPTWGTPSGGQMNADGIHPTDDAATAVIVPNVTAAIGPLIV